MPQFLLAVIVWLPLTGAGYQPMVSCSALSASLTALLEYFHLVAVFQPSHMHLSVCYNNNSSHKLASRFYMRLGDQKLRYDLVWPKIDVVASRYTAQDQC